ncbi:hypothetical protein GCM10010211_78530 [Streptomyces albospinus]|uniref:Uncharacterized protein n=1 Tax=Streptomyces albospinus TaxID=285515 RepID=A0ABQ2VQV1_9ACTN|nr:hypothetical protein GCM10010211_78530 [Streptomyces albospinus]
MFDEVVEELVAQLREGFDAMGGLAEAEQAGSRRQERGEGAADEGAGGVPDRGRHTFNRIVEPSV